MSNNKEIREKLMNSMIEYHNNKNPGLDLSGKNFYPKVKYTGGIYLYERELVMSEFYFELVDSHYTGPTDDKRTLYKWCGNEHCKEEYKKVENNIGTSYLIPLEEAVPYIHTPKSIPVPEKLELYDVVSDSPYDKMTIKDYCAIQWRKPVSDKQWLNDLINKV
jgi:hypothetical protein